jgi:hypothetical protein
MRNQHSWGHDLLIEVATELETGHKSTHAGHYCIADSAADPALAIPQPTASGGQAAAGGDRRQPLATAD